jgi:hypothetical protein
MNLTDPKFKDFALVKEMLETVEVIRGFGYGQGCAAVEEIKKAGRLFLTGEGSSRIFPAKNMMCEMMRAGASVSVTTEGAPGACVQSARLRGVRREQQRPDQGTHFALYPVEGTGT